MEKLTDKYKRQIDYIRISITDRCNLRCKYCIPLNNIRRIRRNDILGYEEILKIVRVAVKMRVKKIRITGGEPLIREGVVDFIKSLRRVEGLDDVQLTTNGILLEEYAGDLYSAGIRRLNISLDTLNPKKFKEITRGGDFYKVMRGIEEAKNIGFSPIKINIVLQKGFNDEEVNDLVKLAIENLFHIRFIEYMPVFFSSNWKDKYLSNLTIKKRIESFYGKLIPIISQYSSGPSENFRITESAGIVGFISSVSNKFCGKCNRVRLSADGKMYQCLFSNSYIDFKTPIREGCTDKKTEELFKAIIKTKPAEHNITCSERENILAGMSSIGG